MSAKVRHHFVDFLADIYGKPANPEGMATRLADAARDLSEGQVRQAAEVVAGKHRAKSFPTFADCLAALRAAKQQPGIAEPAGPVTKANFAERAAAFCRQCRYEPGKVPVITPAEHPEEWKAWRVYFGHIGMKQSASMMRTAGNWTVPALHPCTFDPAYVPPLPQSRTGDSPERREAVLQRHGRTIASIGASGSAMLSRGEMRRLPAGTIIEAGGRIVHTNGFVETFEDFRLRQAEGAAG